jgi:hypothetical protein
MGSTLADIARAEAEENEPETPDVPLAPDELEQAEQEEQDEQDHEQPVEEREPSLTPEQIEANMASWERERNRHMKELQKRDPARYEQSEVCVLCEGHGLFWPTLGEPNDSLRLSAVTQVLGARPDPELLDDPDTEACERCGANGMLKTHSNVEGQRTRICTSCNGQGWKPRLAVVAAPPLFTQQQPANGTASAFQPGQGAPDSWGRPAGHPHYGLLPSQVGA